MDDMDMRIQQKSFEDARPNLMDLPNNNNPNNPSPEPAKKDSELNKIKGTADITVEIPENIMNDEGAKRVMKERVEVRKGRYEALLFYEIIPTAESNLAGLAILLL